MVFGSIMNSLNPFSGITNNLGSITQIAGALGGSSSSDSAPAAAPTPAPAPVAPAPLPGPATPVQPAVEPQPEISLEDLLTQVDELFPNCQRGMTSVTEKDLTDLKLLPAQAKAMRTELMNLPRNVISDDITKEFLTAEKKFYDEFQEVQQKFQEIHEHMMKARMNFDMFKMKSNSINPGSSTRAVEAALKPAPVTVEVEVVTETQPTPPTPTQGSQQTNFAWTPPAAAAGARRLAQAPVTESSYVWPMLVFVLCFVILMGILNFAFRRVKRNLAATPSFRFEAIKIVH
jgi:hypothetical protein